MVKEEEERDRNAKEKEVGRVEGSQTFTGKIAAVMSMQPTFIENLLPHKVILNKTYSLKIQFFNLIFSEKLFQ